MRDTWKLYTLQIFYNYDTILKYKSLFLKNYKYAEIEGDQSNFTGKIGDGPGKVMESSPHIL